GLLLSGAFVARAYGQMPANDWADYQRLVQPFFAKYCLECHTDKKSGDVRLDGFRNESTLAKGVATLDRAAGMLRKKAMPPKKRPQPDAGEAVKVLAWLDAFVAKRDTAAPA